MMFIRTRDANKKCICEECGEEFIKKSPTQIYCSDKCRIKVCNRQNRIYKGFKERKPTIIKPKKKLKFKKKITFGLYTRHK